MRILYAATGEIAVPLLRALAERQLVAAVLTAPDAPGKRGKTLLPSPVKKAALELGLEVYQPETLRKEAREYVRSIAPDALMSFCYGKIFGPMFLSLFSSTFNVHPSLLPLHRGCAPIYGAIRDMDRVTGISVQEIASGVDEGDIFASMEIPLDGTETTASLEERVRKEAQDISEKYINPPRTTDFAILFVPTESLYAELLRDPGYVDGIQNRYKVIISGPTTFSALLISLGMGFRTLQIEKKTKEVRDLFAKIKSLMAKFSEELVQTQNAIGTAGRRIESVIKRNGMIAQKLQNIELSDDGSNSIDIPLIEENPSETE